jgi:hypothetical protein
MLQVKPSATILAKIVEWGVSFDGSAAATPGKVELIETDVAATVTASVANDITKFDANALSGGDPTTNLIQVGTAATGYTAIRRRLDNGNPRFRCAVHCADESIRKAISVRPRTCDPDKQVCSNTGDIWYYGELLCIHDR